MVTATEAARKAIESLYDSTCDVIVHDKVTDAVTHVTSFADKTLIATQPCRLSYKSIPITGDGSTATMAQSVKLIVSPDVDVPTGSKLDVTHNGVTTAYKRSGKPAIYSTHQEIELTLFDRWA